MTFSNSTTNFDDVTEILDRALASPRGVRVPCPSHGHAVRMRQRMNICRRRDRENSRFINAKGDPMYGKSAWDKLEFTMNKKGEEEDNYVFVRKQILESIIIEEL